MSMFGISELLVLLGVLGGFAGGDDKPLTAPHDTAMEAAQYALPDANVVVHLNAQSALSAALTLLDEAAGLQLTKESRSFRKGIEEIRTQVNAGLDAAGAGLGLDVRKGIGSVTFSMAAPSENEVRLLLRIRGDLKTARFLDVLGVTGDKSAKVQKFKGVTLYPMPETGEVKDHVVAMVDDTTFVLGARELVQDIVAKKTWKPGETTSNGRLAKALSSDDRAFVYLAPPRWMSAEMKKDAFGKRVAPLFDGTDYVTYTAGSKGARLRLQAHDPVVVRRVGFLFESVRGLVSLSEPITNALVAGAIGLVPYVSNRKDADSDALVEKDALAMREVGDWVKRRFTGTGEVDVDTDDGTVELALTNSASVTTLFLPMMGGAAAWMLQPMRAPMPDDDYEEPPMLPYEQAPEPEQVP